MKPTENTFFFPFNRLRAQAPHPIEKVELLESLEKPENQQRGLFDLFDLFDRWVSVGKTGGNRMVLTDHSRGVGGMNSPGCIRQDRSSSQIFRSGGFQVGGGALEVSDLIASRPLV